MTLGSNRNNQIIVAIVRALFQVSETHPDKLDELADKVVELILTVFEKELRSSNAFKLPYKDITDVVLTSHNIIKSDSINNFAQNVYQAIEKRFNQTDSSKHHSNKEKYINRFMHCYEKIVEHTLLAQTQREYIKSTIANVKSLAEETKLLVEDARNSADQAKRVSSTAEEIANKAKSISAGAEETANKAEETYNTMFANYVAVLGIFTSIIVTIYGGINIINVIANNNDKVNMYTLITLVALTFLCILTLLYFLALTIVWVTKNQNKNLTNVFILIALICVGAISLGYFKLNWSEKPPPKVVLTPSST